MTMRGRIAHPAWCLLCGLLTLVVIAAGTSYAAVFHAKSGVAAGQNKLPRKATVCWLVEPTSTRPPEFFLSEEERIQGILEEWTKASNLTLTWTEADPKGPNTCSGSEDVRILLSDLYHNCTWGGGTCQPKDPPPSSTHCGDQLTLADCQDQQAYCFWDYDGAIGPESGTCLDHSGIEPPPAATPIDGPGCSKTYGNPRISWAKGAWLVRGGWAGCDFTARLHTDFKSGLYLHEFGHAIGFIHEQKRTDDGIDNFFSDANNCSFSSQTDCEGAGCRWEGGCFATCSFYSALECQGTLPSPYCHVRKDGSCFANCEQEADGSGEPVEDDTGWETAAYDLASVMHYGIRGCPDVAGMKREVGLSAQDRLAVEMAYPRADQGVVVAHPSMGDFYLRTDQAITFTLDWVRRGAWLNNEAGDGRSLDFSWQATSLSTSLKTPSFVQRGLPAGSQWVELKLSRAGLSQPLLETDSILRSRVFTVDDGKHTALVMATTEG